MHKLVEIILYTIVILSVTTGLLTVGFVSGVYNTREVYRDYVVKDKEVKFDGDTVYKCEVKQDVKSTR